jgi:hypothetical protein
MLLRLAQKSLCSGISLCNLRVSVVWFYSEFINHRGRAALDAGCKVIATGRNTDKVVQAVRPPENLFVVKVNVTKLPMLSLRLRLQSIGLAG